ncbi:MAG: dephospho-CoA kinase [Lachnospiraceae bacterium]|nr:dephospho-CoA kinase [Lachnospiraceae bacterium]
MNRRPFVIGVTGGVGSGKSACLAYIEKHYLCLVIYADPEAGKLRKRGEECFEPLLALLGPDVLDDAGEIDSGRMAEKIFADERLLKQVNDILHPAVNARIRALIEAERAAGRYDFVFVEAALLIENGYEELVDELWYIYAEESVRRKRLSASRGYSEEKISQILKGQLSDREFREHCVVVIDNSDDMIETQKRINRILGEHIGGTKRSAD